MDKNRDYLEIYLKNKGIKSIWAEIKTKYVNNLNERIKLKKLKVLSGKNI